MQARNTLLLAASLLLSAATSFTTQAQPLWSVGKDDNGWPCAAATPCTGGGVNANFVQEGGGLSLLPGSPTSPVADQQADNDYYFAGLFNTTIGSVTTMYGPYAPVGAVAANEEAIERAFYMTDNEMRVHFNLADTLQPTDLLSVTFDVLNLHTGNDVPDPHWGLEVYFNGVLVQPEIIIRPAQTGKKYTTPQFSLADVNATVGSGYDNVVTLKGINFHADGGGDWMGFDYVQLDPPGPRIPAPVFPWTVGLADNGWPCTAAAPCTGGGATANFVQENGVIQPLPGSPTSPSTDRQADNDYYFGGSYATTLPGVVGAYGAYTPAGLVSANEAAVERAFAVDDNDLRYHFNLPNTLAPTQLVTVSFAPFNLDDSVADPHYGVEVYFNGVKVQSEIVVRPAQLGQTIETPPFTLGSVNSEVGSGFDNVVSLKGINYNAEGGGNWMGIDYVQLAPATKVIPPPVLPWLCGTNDGGWPLGDGGGPNATFVRGDGAVNSLPGSSFSEEFDGLSDNDYYFAGSYSTVIAGNGTYTPIGSVFVNEEAAEGELTGAETELRYHFNLPSDVSPDSLLAVTFGAWALDMNGADPRYGVEVYFNNVLVQPQMIIRPAQLGVALTTRAFTAASVNALAGPGFDNILTLKGINYNADEGGDFVEFDYVQLIPKPQSMFPWAVGKKDGGWAVGNGGGPNATFVQENGSINPLPGSPSNPEVNQQSDNDYYFAGDYFTALPGIISTYGPYTPIGSVVANEEGAERAFAAADNDLRYHFNLPTTLRPEDQLAVSYSPINLDDTVGTANMRYGIEVYFNGVLVQTNIVMRAAQLGADYTTTPFTLASVGAEVGPGYDNIVSLKGINYSAEGGGNWMGIDYVQLNPVYSSPFPWAVGKDDNDWPVGNGGGPNATFVQENGVINPLPGTPFSPEINGQADNDYYFAGQYSTALPGVIAQYGSYTPVGVVPANEEAAERAFAGADNDLRYHFNLPSSLRPDDALAVTFDPMNLDDTSADPRYGIEVYFNGVLVQPQIVVRPPQLGTAYTSPLFTLASVGGRVGPGFDNVVSLKGISYSAEGGGAWMGIDYVQLNPVATAPPTARITNPVPGSIDACSQVTVRAEAAACCPGVTITRVDFFANGVVALGSDSAAPFEVNVAAAPPGAYALTAVATDSLNHSSTSAPVNITVIDGPPVVTCPAGVVVECSGGLTPVTYTVTATDTCDGPVPVACTPPSGTGFRTGTSNVTCRATDSRGQVGSCSFTVTVVDTTPPNVVCSSNRVVEATDPAGEIVTYVAGAADPCGLVSFDCAPRSGSVFPAGTTTVTCTARDGGGNSNSCSFTVTVTVVQPNEPPVCSVALRPAACVIARTNDPRAWLIALDGAQACIILDGSASSDPDNDPLQFTWTVDGTSVGQNAVVTNCLALGCHSVVLKASDGTAESRCTKEICVVTAGEAVEQCIELVNNSAVARRNLRPLIATLKAAAASFDRGDLTPGKNQLEAFQNKVRAQIAKQNPAEAAAFIECAQKILDAIDCGESL